MNKLALKRSKASKLFYKILLIPFIGISAIGIYIYFKTNDPNVIFWTLFISCIIPTIWRSAFGSKPLLIIDEDGIRTPNSMGIGFLWNEISEARLISSYGNKCAHFVLKDPDSLIKKVPQIYKFLSFPLRLKWFLPNKINIGNLEIPPREVFEIIRTHVNNQRGV